jgi:hypothetical protein
MMSALESSTASDEVKENQIDAYKTVTDMSWNFDYDGNIPKVADLYKRAKTNQWNADDLELYTIIDPSNPIMGRDSTHY